MSKIYLHVGLHKTATTFLQNNVFNNFDSSLEYNPEKLTKLLNRYIKLPDYRDETLILFKEELSNCLKDDKNLLISYEIMSGNLFSCYDNYLENTCLVKSLFSECDVEILLVLRYQVDWLVSTYRESVHEHHYQTIDKFLNIKNGNFLGAKQNAKYENCEPKKLDYFGIIENYQKLYGRDNVNVLYYEDFKIDKKKFMSKIEAIVGSNLSIKSFSNEITNRGYSASGIGMVLKVTSMFKKIKLDFLIPKPIFFFGPKSVYIKEDKHPYLCTKKDFFEKNGLLVYLKFPIFVYYKLIYKLFGRGRLFRTIVKKIIDKIDYNDYELLKKEDKKVLDEFFKNENKKLQKLLDVSTLPSNYIK